MGMPQNTPPQVKPTTRGMGNSSTATLRSAFGGPINGAEDQFASVEALRKDYQTRVMEDSGALESAVASYYGITNYSPNYRNSPNLEDVKTGPAGLPATPYYPNVASPGAGSVNPLDLPNPPEGIKTQPTNNFGSGVSITENQPQAASKKISQTTIGQGLGRYGKSSAAI